MTSTSIGSLEEKTLDYWIVSRAWEGRSRVSVSTQDAIFKLNNILHFTGPQRNVNRRADELMNCIITREPRKSHGNNKAS